MKITIETTDYSIETQKAIASETRDSEVLDTLVKNGDDVIANAAIENSILQKETLEFIINSYVLQGDYELAKKAIFHANITADLIDYIVRKVNNYEVDVYALHSTIIKPETLEFLSERYSDHNPNKVHEIIVNSPKSSKKCLEYILNNTRLVLDRYVDMHKIARNHPNYKSE